MHRIVRPEGSVIIRDHVDVLVKLNTITQQMRWKGRILHGENGAFHSQKLLIIDTSQ